MRIVNADREGIFEFVETETKTNKSNHLNTQYSMKINNLIQDKYNKRENEISDQDDEGTAQVF